MHRETFSSFNTRTISTALAHTRQCIAGLTDTPSLDAQVLLAHVCKKDRAWVLAHPEYRLSFNETLALADALVQLAAGIPLPYVIGEWEFYGQPFSVTPDVLIPRPETELLVETAIEWLNEHPERTQVLEVGTGSGCISICLARQFPNLKITATDISPEALEVARQNAACHEVGKQITFLENNLLDGLEKGPFDLICGNLPYIPTEKLKGLPVYMREPTLALDGGRNGTHLIRQLLSQIPSHIAPGGIILLEIEAEQQTLTKDLARQHFPDADIKIKKDLAGRYRLAVIQTHE